MEFHRPDFSKISSDMLIIAIILILIGLIFSTFKTYEIAAKKESENTFLKSQLNVIFDIEVIEASKRCVKTNQYIPIKYFDDYLYDCDDFSVIGGEEK